MRRDASWVIVDRETRRAVMEIFNPKLVAKVNTEKYEAVPILDYLVTLNATIKAARDGG